MLSLNEAPWPKYDEDTIEGVSRILRTGKVNYWTGEYGKKFEEDFAARMGTEFAVGVANGTLALELALRALQVGPGDEVVVTPRSFIASVSCVLTVGATPVFADVDVNSGNLSAETIRPVLSGRTKAVICVHVGGIACDMDEIMSLAKSAGIFIVEDCAQAHGTRYNGLAVGSIGDVGVFSFCQDKIMSTGGEGGMLITSNKEVFEWAWSFKDHGKSRSKALSTPKGAGFRWLHDDFGSNMRMTEMQSLIGLEQLKKLDSWVAERSNNAKMMQDVADGFECIQTMKEPLCSQTAYYRKYFKVSERVSDCEAEKLRGRIVSDLSQLGVPVFTGSCSEIYLEDAFSGKPFSPIRRLPNAKRVGERAFCFLTHPGLQAAIMGKWAASFERVLKLISLGADSFEVGD